MIFQSNLFYLILMALALISQFCKILYNRCKGKKEAKKIFQRTIIDQRMRTQESQINTFHMQKLADVDDSIDEDLISWDENKLQNFFSYLAELLIQIELTLCNARKPNILKYIQHVKFPYMKSLNVWGNNIDSIEKISWISMPNLENLWICDNHISSFKPFRKLNTPKLLVLDLKNNSVPECKHLEEINSPSLNRIDFHQHENSNYSYDMRVLVKMQAKHPGQLYFSNKLLKQEVLKIIKKRCAKKNIKKN